MDPIVSIIIPSFNRAVFLKDTLKSIQEQTLQNWECLVVDDGSIDETELVIGRFSEVDKRIQFHKRPQDRPKGANACRNYGLELCKGKFINWFDSDDLMHKDKLKLQVEALQKSDFLFSICQSYVFKENIDNIIGLKSEIIDSGQPFEDFFTKAMIIPVQAPVFERSFLIDHGFFFDESLQAGQEWELIARILAEGHRYTAINRPLDYIRQHADSISGDIQHQQKWNYLLGRHKIFNIYSTIFSKDLYQFAYFFFLKHYKDFLRSGHYKHAWFVYSNCILRSKITSFRDSVLLGLSFISFFLFKKGDVFLAKVSANINSEN